MSQSYAICRAVQLSLDIMFRPEPVPTRDAYPHAFCFITSVLTRNSSFDILVPSGLKMRDHGYPASSPERCSDPAEVI